MVFTDVKAILRETQRSVKMSVFSSYDMQTRFDFIVNTLMWLTRYSVGLFFLFLILFFLRVTNRVGC